MILYNLIIYIYSLFLRFASLFNDKAKLWVDGRKNIFKRIEERIKDNTAPVAWFHCASLGEFEQARPVIEKFRTEFSGWKIFLTFFSPSGYEIRKNYSGADYIFYLPIDNASNAKKMISLVKPKVALFVKYEFWHYYISELHYRNIPIISFSAIFRENQAFFQWYGILFRNILRNFSKIFVQNEKSIELLKSIHYEHAEIAGDTRFDRVKEICDNKKHLPFIEKFKDRNKLFIIGSSWPEDMEVLAPIINQLQDIKVIIAPHEIGEGSLRETEKGLSKKYIRYSLASENNIKDFDVLMIDNIGMLSSLYQYADIAYIGGAFGKGLHNILEAATFGMPVFFGPRYEKFQEANDLVERKAAFPIGSTEELKNKLENFFSDEPQRQFTSGLSRRYVQENTGASDKIIHYCKTLRL